MKFVTCLRVSTERQGQSGQELFAPRDLLLHRIAQDRRAVSTSAKLLLGVTMFYQIRPETAGFSDVPQITNSVFGRI
jgi:hypothetical protein